MITEGAEEVEISHAKEHQFIYHGERNSEDDMDQQATADSDIKLTSVGETAATRFEFHEGCLGDDAGFSCPNVESATDAIDSVVNEDSISPGQISNDGGDFACDGNDDDDFRGFASFDEAMPSTTDHWDVGPNDFEPADAQSDDEEVDIGGAASFKDKSCLASTDIIDKYDEDTQSNEDQSSVQKWGGVAPLGDGFSCSEDSKHQNQIKPGSGDDDDFGDLRDVEEVRTLPINQIETEEVLQGKNQQERVTTVNSMNDEDFGDFGEFEEVPPTLMNENETEQIAHAENQPEPAMGISSIDDDDFGDFGDFEGMQSTLMNDSGAEEFSEGKNHPDPASGMSSLGDDDFGDFGNFEEVSSKPINQQDIENSSTACLSKQINQDPEKQPDMAPGISPFDDDDFGDFEEVSSTITDQMLDGKTTESVPTLPVTVLDESVRAMFQTVFATDGRVQLDLDGKESAEFPFDVSLRSVLVSLMTVPFFRVYLSI